MDVAQRIVVTAIVQQRYRAKRSSGFIDAPSRVRQSHSLQIGGRAGRSRDSVAIISANIAIQIEKLLCANDPVVQGFQPILHSRIVQSLPRKTSGRIAAKRRHVGVPYRAARPMRILHRIVHQLRRNAAAFGKRGDNHVDKTAIPGLACTGRVALDGSLLFLGPGFVIFVEIAHQQPAIGDAWARTDAVRVSQAGQQSVQETGKVLCDQELLNRSAGAAKTHRPYRQTVGLDEVLFDHHHCFARQIVVAVLLHHILRGRDVSEPPGKRGIE